MKPTTQEIIAQEIHIHYKRPLFDQEKRVSNSKETNQLLRTYIDLNRIDHKEFFWVYLLTNANQILGISEIGIGSSNGVVVNLKEICQLALLTCATQVVLAHNHTSGGLKPSPRDTEITHQCKDALNLFNIKLLDHLIITSESYFSFSDNDLL